MNADRILDALETIDDAFILQAGEPRTTDGRSPRKKAGRLRRVFVLAAAAVALLALCGFAAYEAGLFDDWLQEPSPDPAETVRSAIENQMDKEYTIAVEVHEIAIDEDETRRIVGLYSGSELAEARGWTDEYLSEHFIVVKAVYFVTYDHTKTFMNDGLTEQHFYLTQNEKTGEWTIVDNTSPIT